MNQLISLFFLLLITTASSAQNKSFSGNSTFKLLLELGPAVSLNYGKPLIRSESPAIFKDDLRLATSASIALQHSNGLSVNYALVTNNFQITHTIHGLPDLPTFDYQFSLSSRNLIQNFSIGYTFPIFKLCDKAFSIKITAGYGFAKETLQKFSTETSSGSPLTDTIYFSANLDKVFDGPSASLQLTYHPFINSGKPALRNVMLSAGYFHFFSKTPEFNYRYTLNNTGNTYHYQYKARHVLGSLSLTASFPLYSFW